MTAYRRLSRTKDTVPGLCFSSRERYSTRFEAGYQLAKEGSAYGY